MTVAVAILAALALGLAAGHWLIPHGRRPGAAPQSSPTRQILLPFTGEQLSRRAFDAALRLARVENATLMPAFIATVPMSLTLESPLPRQCTIGMPLLEAIEQRAQQQGVAVDSRIIRGRSYRDALRRLLATEHFDRVIISATDDPRIGLSGNDILWMLQRAPAEVMILRPAPQDTRIITSTGISGHF
jgi:nucleotide-binding universal stress UspA family protein